MEENKKPETPYAFPFIEKETIDDTIWEGVRPGMTLRDYFAAKALQGWMANPQFINNGEECRYAVYTAYKIADEMLKERTKD